MQRPDRPGHRDRPLPRGQPQRAEHAHGHPVSEPVTASRGHQVGGEAHPLVRGHGQVVHARISGTDRARLLHDTISTLAPVESRLVEADWSALATEVVRLGTHRALVVLLTSLESSAIEEGLLPVLPALAAHHRVVVASVTDPALATMRAGRTTTGEVYDAAAAERAVALRRRTASALEQLGVDVVDAAPDELPVRLADHYLMLKRQGLL